VSMEGTPSEKVPNRRQAPHAPLAALVKGGLSEAVQPTHQAYHFKAAVARISDGPPRRSTGQSLSPHQRGVSGREVRTDSMTSWIA
jgi:hypothetical protein